MNTRIRHIILQLLIVAIAATGSLQAGALDCASVCGDCRVQKTVSSCCRDSLESDAGRTAMPGLPDGDACGTVELCPLVTVEAACCGSAMPRDGDFALLAQPYPVDTGPSGTVATRPRRPPLLADVSSPPRYLRNCSFII